MLKLQNSQSIESFNEANINKIGGCLDCTWEWESGMGIKGMGMGGFGFGNEVTGVVWIVLESDSVHQIKLFGLSWNGNG